MEWVRENWFFILFAVLFIAMHLFGFGCGGHGGHGREEERERSSGDVSGKREQKGGHRC